MVDLDNVAPRQILVETQGLDPPYTTLPLCVRVLGLTDPTLGPRR